MPTKKNRAIYQLKVVLQDIDPPIWRRIHIWNDSTLSQLHRTLQIVMGWEDCHLHEFLIGPRTYSVPSPDDDMYERKVIDERKVRLRDVVSQVETAAVSGVHRGSRNAALAGTHPQRPVHAAHGSLHAAMAVLPCGVKSTARTA